MELAHNDETSPPCRRRTCCLSFSARSLCLMSEINRSIVPNCGSRSWIFRAFPLFRVISAHRRGRSHFSIKLAPRKLTARCANCHREVARYSSRQRGLLSYLIMNVITHNALMSIKWPDKKRAASCILLKSDFQDRRRFLVDEWNLILLIVTSRRYRDDTDMSSA